MYAVIETRTNEHGVMQIVDPIFRTDNAAYAQNKIYTLAAAAVTSNVYVDAILCINEHGQSQFGTPMYFEHIPEESEQAE